MAKRKSFSEDNDESALRENQLSKLSEADICPQLPRTPDIQTSRRRRIDVIDSLGNSPATPTNSTRSYLCGSPSSTTTSLGFHTPTRQQPWFSPGPTHYYTGPSFDFQSPDHGYHTPDWHSRCQTHIDNAYDALPFCNQDTISCTSTEEEIINQLPVSQDADRYNMEHLHRGKCIVFNHENFYNDFKARRIGSTADANNIKTTFERLGFTVEICNDYEYASVAKKIQELSEEDHTNNDCLCIFVLTHGSWDDLLYAYDAPYTLDNLWRPFTPDKCMTLAGKPKLFFVQACRGVNIDKGVTVLKNSRTQTDSCGSSGPYDSYKLPTHADFLFAHSTVKGYFSWRDPEAGTWYIQSICQIIDTYASTTDLMKMLTMVARNVATHYTSKNDLDPAMHANTQIPSTTSRLIRDIYFTPKNSFNY